MNRRRTLSLATVVSLVVAAACSNGAAGPVDPGAPPSNGLPHTCGNADFNGGCAKNCPVGNYCCGKTGDCWDPVALPDNCKFTQCANAGVCDVSTVCQRAQPAKGPHVVTVKNRTGQTVWIAAISSAGALDVAGWDWKLPDGADHVLNVPEGWDAGRIWARTGCKDLAAPDELECEVGDCFPNATKHQRTCTVSGLAPLSVAELSLNGGANRGQPDNYDVSFVDGWNFQIKIEPKTVVAKCPTVGVCSTPPVCWQAGKWPSSGPPYKGCISPCGIKHDARHCCKCDLLPNSNCTCGQDCCNQAGSFGCSPYYPDRATPAEKTNLCIPNGTATRPGGEVVSRPESKWDPDALSYITTVESSCPNVYAWQFHDLSALATCRDDPNSVNYDITFSPSPVQ